MSEIGFTGAAGALVLGINPLYGLLFFTIISGVGIGVLGKRLRERDLTVGILMMFMLGLGSLFIALYNGYAQRAYSILFGTILGISRSDVIITIVFSLIAIVAMMLYFPSTSI